MSISAIIDNVFQDGNDLILDLMPKDVGGFVGQRKMIIKNATYVPESGQEVWGGSDLVVIEPTRDKTGQRRYYKRYLYTELWELDEKR